MDAEKNMELVKELIHGAYDLHVHTGPDVQERKLHDLEMAQRIIECGMAGYVIKSHYFCTAGRAGDVRTVYPQCETIGAVTLNNSVGGLNPVMVEMAARAGSRMIWMPSVDSAHERDYLADCEDKKRPYWHRILSNIEASGVSCPGITLTDREGNLKKEVYDIIEIARKYSLCIATSHISHRETFAVAKASMEMGMRRLLITHVLYPGTDYSLEEQKELVQLGAFLEYSYSTFTTGKTSYERTLENIKIIGPEHCIISSDLGMPIGESPEMGMLKFSSMLYADGISEKMVHRMNRENTGYLVHE